MHFEIWPPNTLRSLNCSRVTTNTRSVMAGQNASTVDVRVVDGEGWEPGAWGYNWATLSLGGHKHRDLVLQVESWMQG
jgi:hypothetical protein